MIGHDRPGSAATMRRNIREQLADRRTADRGGKGSVKCLTPARTYMVIGSGCGNPPDPGACRAVLNFAVR